MKACSISRRTGALDLFRLVAALLVVAIHTSPLLSLGDDADFVLTRILARVAVPFFFLLTGFFTLPKCMSCTKALGTSMRRNAALYLAAAVLYLPIMIYAGYFRADHMASTLLRDLFFNGTFYHLWYFPALLAGLPLTFALARRLPRKTVTLLVSLLYAIGVLGDSWYGISAQFAPYRVLFDSLFHIFDYTRNGLFFAPFFLWLGYLLATMPLRLSVPQTVSGLSASLGAMILEATVLRSFNIPRHDSMYFFLPVVMFFFFSLLLQIPMRPLPALRPLATIIYIIHPMMIVLTRGFAKLTGLTGALVDNSVGHFICVLALSFFLSVFLLVLTYLKRSRVPCVKPM